MGSSSLLFKISVLAWADAFAAYSVWMIMIYLTDVWKLKLTHAAAIINVWNGTTLILPLGLSFLADSFLGNFAVLSLSSIAYCTGLGFLSLSTPPVLGKCHENQPECIGDTQRILFYFALALMSIGIFGHLVTMQRFVAQQTEDEDDNSAFYRVMAAPCGATNAFYLPYIGGITLFYIKPWSIRFGIPAIIELLATLLFFSGVLSYDRKRPEGSPIVMVFRVFVASASKIFRPSPAGDAHLYEHSHRTAYKISRTSGLRCLEKAALILPKKSLEEQKRNRWRLCTVTQVEKTKIILRLLPAWLTVIVCGVVSSAGSSFFLEQAKNMKPMNLGKLKFTIPTILLIYDGSKAVAATLSTVIFVTSIKGRSRKYGAAIGVATAMVFSTLSCIAAAKIESRRLGVISSHGLSEKPEARIPMSMGWLLFQYILNGAAYGFAAQSMYLVFYTQAPFSIRMLLVRITNLFLGLGFIGAVAVVDVAGKVSEKGGRESWFQSTSNQSRLDNYYWTLAGLSAVNLVLCVLVPIGYSFQDFSDENEEMENSALEVEEDQLDTCCDISSCFCCF